MKESDQIIDNKLTKQSEAKAGCSDATCSLLDDLELQAAMLFDLAGDKDAAKVVMDGAAKIRELSKTLQEIKFTALSAPDGAVNGLVRIVRICIDAGITEQLPSDDKGNSPDIR